MPPIFEPVTFSWDGKEYTIPEHQVMKTIARVEDVITLVQLQQAMESGSFPMAKLAQAYAIMLRVAGLRVTDEEVYDALFKPGQMQSSAVGALVALQMMMIPPARLKKVEETPTPKQPASADSAAASSSKLSS